MKWISIFATIGMGSIVINLVTENIKVKLVSTTIMLFCVIGIAILDIKSKRCVSPCQDTKSKKGVGK